jgi:hypothetical protein
MSWRRRHGAFVKTGEILKRRRVDFADDGEFCFELWDDGKN